MNKKLFVLLPALALTLTSCSPNSFAGKSYKKGTASATYEGSYTEASFFEGYDMFFKNLNEFTDTAFTFYSSHTDGETKNKCLNFTNEIGLTGAKYNNRSVDVYSVNHENLDEHHVVERCSYFVENGVAKFVTYNSTMASYVDFSHGGFKADTSYMYSYSWVDTSITQEGDKLNMQLKLTLSTRNLELTDAINRSATVTLLWNKA